MHRLRSRACATGRPFPAASGSSGAGAGAARRCGAFPARAACGSQCRGAPAMSQGPIAAGAGLRASAAAGAGRPRSCRALARPGAGARVPSCRTRQALEASAEQSVLPKLLRFMPASAWGWARRRRPTQAWYATSAGIGGRSQAVPRRSPRLCMLAHAHSRPAAAEQSLAPIEGVLAARTGAPTGAPRPRMAASHVVQLAARHLARVSAGLPARGAGARAGWVRVLGGRCVRDGWQARVGWVAGVSAGLVAGACARACF